MGLENYKPLASEAHRRKDTFGEYFGPLGSQNPSSGPLDQLVSQDASETAMEERARLAALLAHLEDIGRSTSTENISEKDESVGEAKSVHEQERNTPEHLHEHAHEDDEEGGQHGHGHSHTKDSEKLYPSHYEPKPEDVVTGWEREQHFIKGLGWGSLSVALWVLDSIVHLSPIPFDDVVVHGAAIYCTLRALGPLNEGWRGYRIPKEIIAGRKEDYKGEGYPVSPITFARENLRGHYDEGWVKREYSRAALGVSYIGKTLGGMVHQTAHDVADIWRYDESSTREKGVWGFITYTAEGIGRIVYNLHKDGPLTVGAKIVKTAVTIIPSSVKGFAKGNGRFLRDYQAGGIKPNLRRP